MHRDEMLPGPRFKVSVSTDLATVSVWPSVSDMTGVGAFVFQAREFLEVWLATIGRARHTKAVFVRIDDMKERPLMLLPFGIERQGGIRILRFLDGGVADYNAPILFEPAGEIGPDEMRGLWAQLRQALPSFDIAILDKMPTAVGGLANPLRILASPDRASGHLLSLRGTWDSYESRLPRRQDRRRKRRRISEVGNVRFVVAESLSDAQKLLATMIHQKTKRYLETRGIDRFDTPGYVDFFSAMTERFVQTGFVQLSALIVNEEIVATHWGLVAAGRFYFLMPAFESRRWSRFSPGRLLIEELISWSFEKNLRIFDFGVGDEPYKEEYRDDVLQLMRAEIPNSKAGHLFSLYLRRRRGLAASRAGSMFRGLRTYVRKATRNRLSPF